MKRHSTLNMISYGFIVYDEVKYSSLFYSILLVLIWQPCQNVDPV